MELVQRSVAVAARGVLQGSTNLVEKGPTQSLQWTKHLERIEQRSTNFHFFTPSAIEPPVPNAAGKMSSNTTTSGYAPCPSTATPLTITASTSFESPIDNFICGIISAVTKESSNLSQCGNCEEGASAFSKCIECSDLLCDTCVSAHQRVRLTKDHKISRFSRVITPPHASPSPGSVGSLSQTSTSPCNAISNICDNHRELHRYFCQTCQMPSCADCLMEDHSGHQLVYMEDAIEAAKTANFKLNMETRTAMITVRQALDNVQRMLNSVELRSMQAATEVRSVIRRYIDALEEREMELLKIIDQSRCYKGKLLTTQMDNLRMALTKLARTFDVLNEIKDSTNAYELIVANEKAVNEFKQIRSLKSELVPCEDDVIMFLPPDNGFLSAISSIGSITVSSPIMSSKAVATRALKEPQIVVNIPNEVKEESDIFHPKRSRPIYGVPKPVVVMKTVQYLSQTFGEEGEQDGQLCRPWGVCCDRLGRIIVADRSNNRVQIFDGNGKFLHKFGSQGSGPGQFDRPAGIAVNPQGNIVVADKDNHRIQVFKVDGTFVHTFGEKGAMNGQFNYPWDVACNSLGHIVVSDTRNHRIQLFTGDGTFLNKYGYEGSIAMWKHFDSPRGVCFTPKGGVVVTDFNNHRLVIVDPNFLHAQFLGQEGSNNKEFLRPQGVICDDEGNIIVADSRNNRIQVIENKGNYTWSTGLSGKMTNELDRPSGICLNPDGRIVVVDFGNNRVRIF